MKAVIVTATNAVEQFVESADGLDLTGRKLVDAPDDVLTADYSFDGTAFHPDLTRPWAALRAERDRRLAATDWTQTRDQPAERADAWAPYRQSLRDLPDQTADPLHPVWPDPPSET